MARHFAAWGPPWRLTGWALLACVVTSTSALAQTAAGPSQKAQPQSRSAQGQSGGAAPAMPARASVGAAGLTIARDADTGALRAPTESEAAALAAPAPSAPSEVTTFVTPSGAIAAQVPEDFMTYTVVSKNPDGSLTSVCLPDKAAAEAAVRRAASTAPANQSVMRGRAPLRPSAGGHHE